MGLQALAERMRDSINVVHEHYIAHNPLMASKRAAEFSRRAYELGDRNCAKEQEALATLTRAGISSKSISQVQQELLTIKNQSVLPDQQLPIDANATWIAENEALAAFHKHWDEPPPRLRHLRTYCRRIGHARASGRKGSLYYTTTVITKLASECRPMPSAARKPTAEGKRMRRLIARLVPGDRIVMLGGQKLLQKDDLLRVLQASKD